MGYTIMIMVVLVQVWFVAVLRVDSIRNWSENNYHVLEFTHWKWDRIKLLKLQDIWTIL